MKAKERLVLWWLEPSKTNPMDIPAVLVNMHAVYLGVDPMDAVHNSVVLEETAKSLSAQYS